MPKRKKRRGHYCWVCGCIRANERFSGRGHARPIGRDCSKLGAAALADLQTIRNAEGLLRGKWRRNQRKRDHIVRLTGHLSLRVRAFAIDVLYGPFAWIAENSAMSFAWLEADRAWPDSFDDWTEEFFDPGSDERVVAANSRDEVGIVWDDLDSIETRLTLGFAEDGVGEIDARLDVDDVPLTPGEMLDGLATEDTSHWLAKELVMPVDKSDAFGPRAEFSCDDLHTDVPF